MGEPPYSFNWRGKTVILGTEKELLPMITQTHIPTEYKPPLSDDERVGFPTWSRTMVQRELESLRDARASRSLDAEEVERLAVLERLEERLDYLARDLS